MSTHQKFAMKVMRITDLDDYYIQYEVNTHKQLDGDHIVRFISEVRDSSYSFIILELCDGTLFDFVHFVAKTTQKKYLSTEVCMSFAYQIIAGLSYIHGKGFVHRDIKMENILFIDTKSPKIKISDFGLAINIEDPRLTLKQRCGTTHYMAPEVVERTNYGCLVDIWSTGVVVFVLSTGTFPFNGMISEEIYESINKMEYRYS